MKLVLQIAFGIILAPILAVLLLGGLTAALGAPTESFVIGLIVLGCWLWAKWRPERSRIFVRKR
jgi:hypothetical protein